MAGTMKIHTLSFIAIMEHSERKANIKEFGFKCQANICILYGHFQRQHLPERHSSCTLLPTTRKSSFKQSPCYYITMLCVCLYHQPHQLCHPPNQTLPSLGTRHTSVFCYKEGNGNSKNFRDQLSCKQEARPLIQPAMLIWHHHIFPKAKFKIKKKKKAHGKNILLL